MGQVGPRLIPISLGMVNVFLIVGQRSVLVDAGNPGQEERILGQIEAKGVDPETISLIVVTHVHPDHVGGLAAIKARTGAQVAVHSAEAHLLRQGIGQEVVPVTALGRLFTRLMPKTSSVGAVAAEVIVEDELDLGPFGVRGTVVSTPGHTPGSMSVHLAGGQVIVGDLIMAFFRRRRPGYPIFAYDKSKVQSSVRSVLSWKPTAIYASHGGPWSPDDVAAKFGLDIAG